MFEPTHGSAPDISGKGIANPLGTFLSVAMMFEYAFARADIARRIEHSVEQVLNQQIFTPDLGGKATTLEMKAAVLAALTRAD